MVLTVAVVGAGAAGLAAARRLEENKSISYTVFEQADEIGGTWVYDERVGLNEHGLPIHTSMYRSLRTNLPKEVMGYPEYPIRNPENKSYIDAADIFTFLREFAEEFKIIHSIKFHHLVRKIEPATGSSWTVTVEDLAQKATVVHQFDAVIVCNGHYHIPNTPKLHGDELFLGKIMHSHDYRVPGAFKGLSVVVVGAGPSGLDIALDISQAAHKVVVSHHLPDQIDTVFPSNVIFKPDIEELSENAVTFIDGTSESANCILFCTGYKYSLPFLSDECGVKIRDNYVHPLYKHLIAINRPTLCLVGLPFYVCAFSMFDLQVRFFLATLTGDFVLPTREEMLAEEQREMSQRRANGLSFRESHKMGPMQGDYYSDLARVAGVKGLAPVLTKLHNESSRRFLEDLINFRQDRYAIVDDDTFIELH